MNIIVKIIELVFNKINAKYNNRKNWFVYVDEIIKKEKNF